MTTLRRFCCDDLLSFNRVNLDVFTETCPPPPPPPLSTCSPLPDILPHSLVTTALLMTRTNRYNMGFYLTYLAKWPEYCITAEGPAGNITGYILGKAEGEGTNWHGHVTAVTVEPDYRRQGLAKKLMDLLEDVTETVHDGYFVDLFVRVSNHLAVGMYRKFGYSVYRRVIGYYSGDEDAYGEESPPHPTPHLYDNVYPPRITSAGGVVCHARKESTLPAEAQGLGDTTQAASPH